MKGQRTVREPRSVGAAGTLAAVLAATLAACGGTEPPADPDPDPVVSDGRLTARAGTPTGTVTPGLTELGLGGARDGALYVPVGYDPTVPTPLAMVFHGVGGSHEALQPLFQHADQFGVVLLIPESRGMSWDLPQSGNFGPDVSFIDDALRNVFSRVNVDPSRIMVAGFDDGASYSLSIGLTNGDLFSHVAAWSPAFVFVQTPAGQPRVFVSHGTLDRDFAFELTRDSLVPVLLQSGYMVEIEFFEGGHEVPTFVAHATFEWFTTT